MSPRLPCLTVLLVAALLAAPALADPDPTPDPDAEVVLLRKDCGPTGSETENCFESMSSLADPSSGWIWNTRTPGASDPLLVDIGPGEFGGFTCDGGSHVSLRGSGREHSVLTGTDQAAEIKNCDQLAFLDLGFRSPRYAVNWIGGGFATWSGVDLHSTGGTTFGTTTAWADSCDFQGTPERSVHYFHGSRIRTTGVASTLTAAYYSLCAETWFFGGEILLDVPSQTSNAIGIYLALAADFRAFGTPLRARVTGDVLSGTLIGVNNLTLEDLSGLSPPLNTLPGGMFHAHGSIINTAVAPGVSSNINATALLGAANSFSHTPGTAFVVKSSGTGVATRVSAASGAKVLSPFLWQSGATPPQSATETNTLASADGQDIYVETDCDASGDCNGAGTETHMMIYNEAECGSSNPWFDSTIGACRQ